MSPTDPDRFYRERVPTQFNRDFAAQEAIGEEGAALLARMRAVDATIRVEVVDAAGGPYYLNIEKGQMNAGDDPKWPPFMTIEQDLTSFGRIVRESGDSVMSLLGGLLGLQGKMHLTAMRVQSFSDVDGLVHLEVTGDAGFALRLHLGEGPCPGTPDTKITLDEKAYSDLRSGALDPQGAFMNSLIRVEGDMQKAMQLALAAVAPD